MHAGVRAITCLLVISEATMSLAAQDSSAGSGGKAQPGPSPHEVFEPPLASPTEPANLLRFVGNSQYDFGLTQPFALYTDEGKDATWQLGIQPAFVARFQTSGTQLTLQAADFRLGIPIAFHHGKWSGRVEVFHVSSHRGADSPELGPGPSFSYSREAVQALLAYGQAEHWRIYAGPSVLVHRHPAVGRASFQAGSEWFPQPASSRYARFFLADDFETHQEVGWQMNYSLEPGVRFTTARGEPIARLAAWFYRGQVPFGQFFRERETVVGAVVTLELRPALKSLVTRKH